MEQKRQIQFDLMRIVACFCVIMIHASIFDQKDAYPYASLEYQAFNIWGTLSRWAVPVFVMLSGMMTIQKSDSCKIKDILWKRVFRMLGAYIAWSVIYSAYNVFVLNSLYAGTKFKTFIDGCFSGELHMWYLPMLAGLYLISPLLAVLIAALNKKWTLYWTSLLFIFSSLIPFWVKLNVKFLSVIVGSINGYMDLHFLQGWTLYYILGYYLRDFSFNRKTKLCVYILSGLSLLFTLFATVGWSWMYGESMGVLTYEYPNIVLFSIGVFLFFRDEVANWKWIYNHEMVIITLSKLTFGIYLSHVLILKILYYFGVDSTLFHPMSAIPFLALIVFVLGATLSWFFQKIPFIGRFLA